MKQYDLGSGNIRTLTLKLCLPTCLAQGVMVLYSIVDRMFIGHIPEIGDLALAGVGVAAPLTTLIVSFAMLVGLGGSPLMAMKEGHKEHEKAVDILTGAFFMLLIFSAVLTPLLFIFRYPVLSLFGASEVTIVYAASYFGWHVVGTPFALLSTGLNSFLIGQGESRRAMISVLTGALLNVILDPVFIFTLDLGVAGGAIATVISQIASAVITVSGLLRKDALIRLAIRKVDRSVYSRITVMGLSPFIINATDNLLLLLLNAMLQKYGGPGMGDILLTAATIIQSYYLLCMNPLGGITGGSQGVISFNYGAGKCDRVTKAFHTIQIMAVIYTVIMTAVTYIAGEYFIRFFTSDETVIPLTLSYMKVFTLMIIPQAFHYTNVDTLTALGQVRLSLPLSLFRKLVFFVACIALPPVMGAGGAFWAEPASDLLGALLSTAVMYTMLPRILKRRQEKGLNIG